MKRIVFLTCIGSLALALTALGAPKEKQTARSGKGKPSAHAVSDARSGKVAAPRVTRSAPRVTRSAPRVTRSAPQVTQSKARISRSARTTERARTVARGRTSPSREKAVTRAETQRTVRAEAARTRTARTAERVATAKTVARERAERSRERTAARAETQRTRAEAAKARARQTARDRKDLSRERAVARTDAQRRIRAERERAEKTVAARTREAARTNLRANRQRNLTLARNVLRNRAGDVRITNNWRGERFRRGDYWAFHNYRREWHDRDWWDHNHTNIVFVLGGWWYWNTGYWYPAWGYDPYAWYGYDGPIYTGYAEVAPDQVLVNVQVALRDQGYYAGAIDGAIGPQTRAALAAFQSDNGLVVTSAVDKPTLETLGLA
jgi:Putative peptidoglycan binding domain